MFPRDNSNDVRVAINFYTALGLGGLTGVLVGVVTCRAELRDTLAELRAKRAK